MHHLQRGRRTEGERYPSRRMSSIGGGSTGWRSSLETNPHQPIWSFIGQLVVAAAAFAAILFALAWLSG